MHLEEVLAYIDRLPMEGRRAGGNCCLPYWVGGQTASMHEKIVASKSCSGISFGKDEVAGIVEMMQKGEHNILPGEVGKWRER